MEDVSVEQLLEGWKPGTADFPKLLGGVSPSSPSLPPLSPPLSPSLSLSLTKDKIEPNKENMEEDMQYIGLNYLNLRQLVENAAKRGNGLLRHMW
jgi:hypothetical protein